MLCHEENQDRAYMPTPTLMPMPTTMPAPMPIIMPPPGCPSPCMPACVCNSAWHTIH